MVDRAAAVVQGMNLLLLLLFAVDDVAMVASVDDALECCYR